jgi:methylmalonyl-CoA/ethylmalonyl-CoA epimerase
MEKLALNGIHHLGHAVRDLGAAARFYEAYLGARPTTGPEEVAEQGVVALMLDVGGSRTELLQPMSPDSPVARFLDRRGEGLHHVAYEVGSIEDALEGLRAGGMQPLDEAPRRGAGGSRVAFLAHPKDALGLLVELVEPPGREGRKL